MNQQRNVKKKKIKIKNETKQPTKGVCLGPMPRREASRRGRGGPRLAIQRSEA